MSYALPEDCKAYTPNPAIQAKTDPELVALIARAERIVNAFTKNDFNLSAEQTILVDGSGSRRLILPKRLVVLGELQFLQVDDGGAVITSSETVLDVFNKQWSLVSEFVFPIGEENISVKGTFGYATVPPEVQDSTCSMVERIVLQENEGTFKAGTFDSEKIGDYSYRLRGTEGAAQKLTASQRLLPEDAQVLLKEFIKPILMTAVRRRNRGI